MTSTLFWVVKKLIIHSYLILPVEEGVVLDISSRIARRLYKTHLDIVCFGISFSILNFKDESLLIEKRLCLIVSNVNLNNRKRKSKREKSTKKSRNPIFLREKVYLLLGERGSEVVYLD